MSYPHKINSRSSKTAVLQASGDCGGATVTSALNVPVGMLIHTISVDVYDTDNIVILTVKPYIDKAQTVVGGDLFLMEAGGTTPAALFSMSASVGAASGKQGTFVAGTATGVVVGVMSVYGMRLSINSISTTGTWKVTAIAVEA